MLLLLLLLLAAAAAAAAACIVFLEAADRFFNSVIMKAHNFIKPKASPYYKQITIKLDHHYIT